MKENPYEPTSSSIADSKTTVPHSSSVRAEAWRGFKFGAKVTGIAMFVIAALVGMGMLGMAIYAMIVTKGTIMNEFNYLEIAKGIGGSIFAVLLMSFYGGVAGGIIMTLAAIVRKRRIGNTASKTK